MTGDPFSRHSGKSRPVSTRDLKRSFLTGCALFLVCPAISHADDITVPSGTTVTTTQTLTDDGDTGLVESGGVINVTDEDGFVLVNDNQTVTNNGDIFVEKTVVFGPNRAGIGSDDDNATIQNNGSITTQGVRAFGIVGDGLNLNVSNAGTINTAGDEAFGIFSLNTDATISNSGSVITSGEDADAIKSLGSNTSITNSGTVMTSGEDAHGIDADGAGSLVTNNGEIATTGEGGHGIDTDNDSSIVANNGSITIIGDEADAIDADGDNVTVTNTGTLSVSGLEGDGIDVNGDGATISSSGTIGVSGTDSNGIEASGDGTAVANTGAIYSTGPVTGGDPDVGHGISLEGDNVSATNSGTIFSDNGSSLYIDGSNATVNLNEGTVLQGLLTFTDTATATLNYAANRTAILTFSSVPDTITTGGLTSRTSGSTVTILNPEDFRLDTTAVTVNALMRETAGTLERQMDADRLSATSFVATNGRPAKAGISRNAVWVSPFGGVLNREGHNGSSHGFGGLMAGTDRALTRDLRAGVAAGVSAGSTQSKDDVHAADSYSIFGGGYAAKNWQSAFAQVSLLGGYLKSDEDITVLNNMVAGGLQTLSADYDYLYVSPVARIGHVFAVSNGTLTPSVRARYSGLWQTGSTDERTTGFSTSGRSLHVLELRGQASYDFAPLIRDSGALFFNLNAGADGTFTLADNADASFAGTSLDLSTGSDTVVRGFAMANAVWKTNGGARVLASVEGGYDSAETLSASVRLGAKLNF